MDTTAALVEDVNVTPAEQPWTALDILQQAETDSGELVPELINARHEEYLARCALDELLERGALAAVFG